MFGVQWDLMLKYIEKSKINSDSKIKEKLSVDSSIIGNYKNSKLTLNRGKYIVGSNIMQWYDYNEDFENCIKSSKKLGMTSALITTGSSDETNLQGIYDISGNVWEWTLEKADMDSKPCSHRGGGSVDDGAAYPSSFHARGSNEYNLFYLGFRVSLF